MNTRDIVVDTLKKISTKELPVKMNYQIHTHNDYPLSYGGICAQLYHYLLHQGVYYEWTNIVDLVDEFMNYCDIRFNKRWIHEFIGEDLWLCGHRYEVCKLMADEIESGFWDFENEY